MLSRFWVTSTELEFGDSLVAKAGRLGKARGGPATR
jgi:hypothetical protein